MARYVFARVGAQRLCSTQTSETHLGLEEPSLVDWEGPHAQTARRENISILTRGDPLFFEKAFCVWLYRETCCLFGEPSVFLVTPGGSQPFGGPRSLGKPLARPKDVEAMAARGWALPLGAAACGLAVWVALRRRKRAPAGRPVQRLRR